MAIRVEELVSSSADAHTPGSRSILESDCRPRFVCLPPRRLSDAVLMTLERRYAICIRKPIAAVVSNQYCTIISSYLTNSLNCMAFFLEMISLQSVPPQVSPWNCGTLVMLQVRR